MNNLYIVRTPLQLFNAFEARQRFAEIGTRNILLLVYGNMNDYSIFKKMTYCLIGWDEIIFFKFKGLAKNLYAFKLPFLLDFHDKYNNIFTGMIYHIPLHLINKLDFLNLWLIDDGNETRLIVNNLESGVYYRSNKSKKILGIIQNPDYLKKIKFFTIYDDLNTSHDVIINDYRFFKKSVSDLEVKKNSCLLIGSNLIGNYIKSKDDYYDILKNIFFRFKDYNLYYAPHRYFTDDDRLEVQKIGYKIFQYESILEIAQVAQSWRFEKIISIRSSAVDTLQKLYGIEGCYIKIPKEYFTSESKWKECQEIWNNHTCNLEFD